MFTYLYLVGGEFGSVEVAVAFYVLFHAFISWLDENL